MVRKSSELTVPSITWIGVFPSEIDALDLVKLPLSGGDNKKINDMLLRTNLPEDVRCELRVASERRVKTEIEGLYDVGVNYLIDVYLVGKIKKHLGGLGNH